MKGKTNFSNRYVITNLCYIFFTEICEVMEFSEQNWKNVVMPIHIKEFANILNEAGYNKDKAAYLVQGFTNGFDIGYRGPKQRKHESNNIPIKPGVGSLLEMWNKIMKEVKENYAGPFEWPPTSYYVQSPLGLVPKAGNKTRLIFHLSFDFGEEDEQKSTGTHQNIYVQWNIMIWIKLCVIRYRCLIITRFNKSGTQRVTAPMHSV